MTQYFLGVDVGNSKSHTIIADSNAQLLAFASAGCGSWEGLGWDGAQMVLHQMVGDALGQANLTIDEIAGAGFGYAGYDWAEDELPHRVMIESLGMNAPYALVNDAMLGLVAGSSEGWGVGVIAGTSNNARGRDKNGRIARVTGHGIRMGEYGGALEIVLEAVKAVAGAWTGRGAPTKLTQAFIDYAGAKDEEDLIAGIARYRYKFTPAIAPTVVSVANDGDAVAREIIRWAGTELGQLANTIIRKLGFENVPVEIVLSGSVYQIGEMLVVPMHQTIHQVAPQAKFIWLDAPPVAGAVLLGMEQRKVSIAGIRTNLLSRIRRL